MTDIAVAENVEVVAQRPVDEVLLLPLRPESSDLFGAWLVPNVGADVRVLVGVRGGQVIAIAGVKGFTRDEGDPRRVVFNGSNEALDLRALADLLDQDVHSLRGWGGPRRLIVST